MPTGPIYETNLVNKRNAIPDEVFNIEQGVTPVFSMLAKQNVGANMLGQVTLEKFPAAASTGILDGAPVTTVAYVARESADVCGQHFRRPWGVTTLAELTSTFGVANEAGNQKLWAMQILKRMIEVQICSATDCAAESGATPWTTRGILSWLSPSAQTTRPVPSNFRPASASQYTGSMTTAAFTDTALKALMAAAFGEKNAPLNLDLFVGATCKTVIGEMTQADPYRKDGLDTVYDRVMLVDFDFGTCRVHLSPFIAWDTSTGLATSYSPLSGFGIDKGQWSWEWLKGKVPANTNLPEDGSGSRGYVDAVGRLWSKNPQGQISIYTATSS